MFYHCFYFFFFSSRRRHTRFDCDWSSDVCSSDLLRHVAKAHCVGETRAALTRDVLVEEEAAADLEPRDDHEEQPRHQDDGRERSEERRVGKECRCRWWP